MRFFSSAAAVFVLRQDAVGIEFFSAGSALLGRRHDLGHDVDQVRRIEPGVAQLVEALRGLRDGDGARVGGEVLGGDVRRQALGEGEGFEGGGGGIAGVVASPRLVPRRSDHVS